jgi:hypothetical protein
MSVGAGEHACSAPDAPERFAVPLDAGVEQGMRESRGIVVAPSLEICAGAEEQGLADADTVTGDFFAFDIQASLDSL